MEDLPQHLSYKVAQIHSQLDTSFIAGPEGMPGEDSCPVIWEQSEPVGPDKMDRVLRTMSSATDSLELYSSWLVKAVWKAGIMCVLVEVNYSFECVYEKDCFITS